MRRLVEEVRGAGAWLLLRAVFEGAGAADFCFWHGRIRIVYALLEGSLGHELVRGCVCGGGVCDGVVSGRALYSGFLSDGEVHVSASAPETRTRKITGRFPTHECVFIQILFEVVPIGVDQGRSAARGQFLACLYGVVVRQNSFLREHSSLVGRVEEAAAVHLVGTIPTQCFLGKTEIVNELIVDWVEDTSTAYVWLYVGCGECVGRRRHFIEAVGIHEPFGLMSLEPGPRYQVLVQSVVCHGPLLELGVLAGRGRALRMRHQLGLLLISNCLLPYHILNPIITSPQLNIERTANIIILGVLVFLLGL